MLRQELTLLFPKSRTIREDLMARLQGQMPASLEDKPLQKRMSEIGLDLRAEDAEEGNGGAEIIEILVRYCHLPPPEEFTSVREYLDYRYYDVGNKQVIS